MIRRLLSLFRKREPRYTFSRVYLESRRNGAKLIDLTPDQAVVWAQVNNGGSSFCVVNVDDLTRLIFLVEAS